jgi:hypothetical protein
MPETGMCRYCGIALTLNNWSLSNRRQGYRCCNDCNRNKAQIKYLTRKGKLRETIITTKINGKAVIIRTKKRPYTNKCELCGTQSKTAYHHWNPLNPHWGLWLCWHCHMLAEGLDEKGINLASKYLDLKPSIESSWTN